MGKMGRTVVVAVDGSPCSRQAFEWAQANVLRPGDAVLLLHVFPHFVELDEQAGRTVAVSCSDSSVQEALDRTVDLLQGMKAACEAMGVEADVAVESGDARGFIPLYCERLQASCLVIGSRGLGGLRRLILGSVSDYCVHNCKCPVIVVRPDQL